jgi:hypothetical protein
VAVDSAGNRYDGPFVANQKHGPEGYLYYADGSQFQGIWRNDHPQKGILIRKDGAHFSGDWREDN